MLFLDYIPELTPLEMDIYHFIAHHLERTATMKIKELAMLTHTSPTSITRFCKKFECASFSEFKIKLRMYTDSLKKSKIADADETSYIDFLQRVNQEFLKNKIEQAVHLLQQKSLVLFLGSGSSETIAEYGSLYFSNLSKTALKISDPSNYPIEWFPEDIAAKTCVIVLSISGETEEMIRYLQRLNQKDCTIIAITNTENSPISKLSHITIPYFIERETIYKTSGNQDKTIELTSQLPALFLIEKIAKRLRLSQEIQ
ncbi:MurR/RpiR family transcriptional regulator [Enterococcus saccharolyticus]|uniref:RpiR family transcriptional regulator n=1 Tax=Candidatus Enterococcus willemsii TaxID=1857215 RepID=A0ABQ6Z0H5_9ENTE|nr:MULTISPECIES: MurR/RpiR family transcriptional regulator [Enterococcus]KAF1304520.1 RpiR family transcriptional regulator [Enterococcus sp. CU12B]MCD5001251.1 MurR/RpiR family transcriptional regulator [Enterococcus saccharolyticus]